MVERLRHLDERLRHARDRAAGTLGPPPPPPPPAELGRRDRFALSHPGRWSVIHGLAAAVATPLVFIEHLVLAAWLAPVVGVLSGFVIWMLWRPGGPHARRYARRGLWPSA